MSTLQEIHWRDLEKEQDLTLIRGAIKSLGVWLHPTWYGICPHLTPFAVRDAESRSKANPDGIESWGSPSPAGFLRDDNSLIKNWVKSLTVRSPHSYFNAGRLKTGFVACHVWRGRVGDKHLHAHPLFNSFVPNLVWLPKPLARESDVVGSDTQRILQATAFELYSRADIASALREQVGKAWSLLDLPPEDDTPLDPSELSFFEFDPGTLERRAKSLRGIVRGIQDLVAGRDVSRIYSSRYAPGLKHLERSVLMELEQFLSPYLEAMDSASERRSVG